MIDWSLGRLGIFRVTDRIYLGEYPDATAFARLATLGVTDILNVAATSYDQPGFTVHAIPLQDLEEMPLADAERAVRLVKRVVTAGGRIFVHCMAGQNRSPGVLFLSLLHLGHDAAEAERMIVDASLDAIPRHPLIVTPRVVEYVRGLK
jgi:protein-tyrosine phosphatase